MGNLLLTALFLFGFSAKADEVNLLKNPGFESRIAKWSKTGSSTFTIQSASPMIGNYSADWDASATGEYLRSSLVAIPNGMLGGKCSADFIYIWDSGVSGDIKMNVSDGTTVIATVNLEPTSSSVRKRAALSFECPTSGSLRLELESTANAASIRIDDAFLGSGKNNLQLSQASMYGGLKWVGVTNCEWATTSASWTNFTADADCTTPTGSDIYGAASAPATKVPGITFANLPPGEYLFKAIGVFEQGNSSDYVTAWRFHDGTNPLDGRNWTTNGATSGNVKIPIIEGRVRYTTAQSNITFNIQGKSNGSSNVSIENDVANDKSLVILVYRYPLSAAEAVTLDTTGSSWSGYHDSTCSWSRTSTSYGDPTADASCNLVERTNSGFGTVSASGSVLPKITFTPRQIGKYHVDVLLNGVRCGATSANYSAQLTDGTTQIAEVGADCISGGVGSTQMKLSGIYDISSLSARTLSVQTKSSSSSVILNISANTAIEWLIYPINQQFPAPVFTELQNVAKSTTSGIKIVSARINNSGTPAVAQQDGTWISSLTDNGIGDTTINVAASVFSAAPNCTCTTYNTADPVTCAIDSTTSISSTAVRVQTYNAGGSVGDGAFSIICVGAE